MAVQEKFYSNTTWLVVNSSPAYTSVKFYSNTTWLAVSSSPAYTSVKFYSNTTWLAVNSSPAYMSVKRRRAVILIRALYKYIVHLYMQIQIHKCPWHDRTNRQVYMYKLARSTWVKCRCSTDMFRLNFREFCWDCLLISTAQDQELLRPLFSFAPYKLIWETPVNSELCGRFICTWQYQNSIICRCRIKSTARATLRRTLRCRRFFVETFLCVVVFAAAATEQPNSLKDWPLDTSWIQNKI